MDDGIVVVIGFIDIIGSNVVVTVPFVLLSGACLISCVAPNFKKDQINIFHPYFLSILTQSNAAHTNDKQREQKLHVFLVSFLILSKLSCKFD